MRKTPLILSICVLIIAASNWFGWQFYQFMQTPLNVDSQGVVYDLLPGTGIRQVALQLHEQGILEHPLWFVWLARYRNQAQFIKAGEYKILPGRLPGDLITQFAEGRVMQHELRLGEGWTLEEVLEAVETEPKLNHRLTSKEPADLIEQLEMEPQIPHPEGWFFPDTYHFPKGTTDIAFLKRAHELMQANLLQEWKQRAEGLPYKTPYEALIMASIIERETGVTNEYAQVAGVYVRRLQQGMRLQADPTVIYGLGANYQEPLTRENLQTLTPYNTYMINGLPPTPIGLPSHSAIHAALHPAAGTSLYFVATGEGGHYFSSTLAEHNLAVNRYREWQQNNK